jgi:hypothetical protein
MLNDVIVPIIKQKQILEIEFGELKVEKEVIKTGKTARYFIYINLACRALTYAVSLLEKAEKELKRNLQ